MWEGWCCLRIFIEDTVGNSMAFYEAPMQLMQWWVLLAINLMEDQKRIKKIPKNCEPKKSNGAIFSCYQSNGEHWTSHKRCETMFFPNFYDYNQFLLQNDVSSNYSSKFCDVKNNIYIIRSQYGKQWNLRNRYFWLVSLLKWRQYLLVLKFWNIKWKLITQSQDCNIIILNLDGISLKLCVLTSFSFKKMSVQLQVLKC